MKLTFRDDKKYGDISWDTPIKMSYIPDADRRKIFDTMVTEKRSEVAGQLFFHDIGGCSYTICRGSDRVYRLNADISQIRMFEVLSVSSDEVIARKGKRGSQVPHESPVYISTAYLKMNVEFVDDRPAMTNPKDTMIIVNHAGYKVAPAVVRFDTFAAISQTAITYDGNYSVTTAITLTDADVAYFEMLMNCVDVATGSIIGTHLLLEVPERVQQMLKCFGIAFNTEHRIRDCV